MRRLVPIVLPLALAAAGVAVDEIFRTDEVPTIVATEHVQGEAAPPDAPACEGWTLHVDARAEGDYLVARPAGGGQAADLRGPVDHLGGVRAIEVAPGRSLVAWDEFRGEVALGASFDIVAAWLESGEWGSPFTVASGPRFQARPSLAASPAGDAWVAWEEGPEGWGGEYRSVDRLWNNPTDVRGPLHTWRAVRLAHVKADRFVAELRGGVPMPSFQLQRESKGRRRDTERLGVFYERPEIAFDRAGGLWLALRHVHQAQLSEIQKTRTHVEHGFVVHLHRLTEDGWSAPMRLDQRQRDGDQPLRLRAEDSGMAVECVVGRSDRRKDEQFDGLVRALLPVDAGETVDTGRVVLEREQGRKAPELRPRDELRSRPTLEHAGATHTLLFGDLHRHTDLSLCFPFYDGSLDDAYRYVRGPGALDFVAITDHARDLDRGNAAGVPWARTVAYVDRYHVPGRFAVFYSYERSQGNCDHNVVSLRPDVLRPHRPPLREFWAEFSADEVITIPHATAPRPGSRFCGNVWEKQDDERRPLAEVYQAYRDVDSLKELQVKALARGQKLGFIASSDHLATSGAYACAWVEGSLPDALDREPIFSALRARRTYGATARIELAVTSGDAWMGEDLEGEGPFPISVRVRGTAPIERVEMWSAGERIGSIDGSREEGGRALDLDAEWTWDGPPPDASGWLIVVAIQRGGHRAWASPFFVDRGR